MRNYVHLSCPHCQKPHVDEGVFAEKPHRTHRCVDDAAGKGCGSEWDAEFAEISVLPVHNYAGRMWAEESRGKFWHQHQNRRFVVACGAEPENIVEVDVREDPQGDYHGWMAAGEQEPCFIWPSQMQRDMCFTYGPQAEEERGRGRRVQLSCKKVEAAAKEAP